MEALDAWTEGLRGIAAVVTGAGKTMFAQMCMLRFRHLHPNGRFLIIVPTLALLDQWYVSLREDLGVSQGCIATYSGESRPAEAATINLMVANTARTYAPRLARDHSTMLIVDECHRVSSPANSSALQGLYAASLGISATPERQYDDMFEKILVPALGPIIYRYDYETALSDGVIVPFELVNIESKMSAEEQAQYDTASRDIARAFRQLEEGAISKQAIAVKLRRRARISMMSSCRIPIAIRLVEDNRHDRTLIFHESIQWARTIQEILTARGVNAALYHSRISPELRRDNLRLYRRGVFDVLVTCRALDEGINVPETTIAIIVSSTASYRQRIQRLGRVLRPAHGKNQATVYTIYATREEARRLLEETRGFNETVSTKWMRSTYRGQS